MNRQRELVIEFTEENFSKSLKKLRAVLGYSLEDFATVLKASGMKTQRSKTTLIKYESGDLPHSFDYKTWLFKLENALWVILEDENIILKY